jgi:ketosteroid isomerase-like protein
VIKHVDRRYGPDSRNRLGEATSAGPDGARSALESFYHALNHRDSVVLRDDWADHPLVQLNNPLGGIRRGGDAVASLYAKMFRGRVRLTFTLEDIVEYLGQDHALFAGREVGSYVVKTEVPLQIRTTRYFRFEGGRWRQYHHHGSIDDPDALRAYQQAVIGAPDENPAP